MKKIINIITVMLLATCTAWGQNTEQESLFRQSGKIYVVVTILSVIFLGLAVYLFAMDRKISRLEKLKKKD